MFTKIVAALVLVAAVASFTASGYAGPVSDAEKAWMDRASQSTGESGPN